MFTNDDIGSRGTVEGVRVAAAGTISHHQGIEVGRKERMKENTNEFKK